jgi:hypothetical protein
MLRRTVLDLAALVLGGSLQLPRGDAEHVPDNRIKRIVHIASAGLALDHQLLPSCDRHVDTRPVGIADILMPLWLLHRYRAAHQMVADTPEFKCASDGGGSSLLSLQDLICVVVTTMI